eukprot:symbB.v1.2.040942.t1/scaffold7283.1/size13980/1
MLRAEGPWAKSEGLKVSRHPLAVVKEVGRLPGADLVDTLELIAAKCFCWCCSCLCTLVLHSSYMTPWSLLQQNVFAGAAPACVDACHVSQKRMRHFDCELLRLSFKS